MNRNSIFTHPRALLGTVLLVIATTVIVSASAKGSPTAAHNPVVAPTGPWTPILSNQTNDVQVLDSLGIAHVYVHNNFSMQAWTDPAHDLKITNSTSDVAFFQAGHWTSASFVPNETYHKL